MLREFGWRTEPGGGIGHQLPSGGIIGSVRPAAAAAAWAAAACAAAACAAAAELAEERAAWDGIVLAPKTALLGASGSVKPLSRGMWWMGRLAPSHKAEASFSSSAAIVVMATTCDWWSVRASF